MSLARTIRAAINPVAAAAAPKASVAPKSTLQLPPITSRADDPACAAVLQTITRLNERAAVLRPKIAQLEQDLALPAGAADAEPTFLEKAAAAVAGTLKPTADMQRAELLELRRQLEQVDLTLRAAWREFGKAQRVASQVATELVKPVHRAVAARALEALLALRQCFEDEAALRRYLGDADLEAVFSMSVQPPFVVTEPDFDNPFDRFTKHLQAYAHGVNKA